MNINIRSENLSLLKLQLGVDSGEFLCQASEHWNEDLISDFIDSILIKLPMMPILLIEERTYEKIWYSVGDGNKRLEAIYAFMSDRVPLTRSLLSDYPDLTGRLFSEIPRPLQRRLEQTEIPTHVIRLGTDASAKELIIARLSG